MEKTVNLLNNRLEWLGEKIEEFEFELRYNKSKTRIKTKQLLEVLQKLFQELEYRNDELSGDAVILDEDLKDYAKRTLDQSRKTEKLKNLIQERMNELSRKKDVFVKEEGILKKWTQVNFNISTALAAKSKDQDLVDVSRGIQQDLDLIMERIRAFELQLKTVIQIYEKNMQQIT